MRCVLKTVAFALYLRVNPWTTLHPCAGTFLALVPRAGSRGSEERVAVWDFGEVMGEGAVLRGDGERGGRAFELRCARSPKTFEVARAWKALTPQKVMSIVWVYLVTCFCGDSILCK